MDHSFEFTEKKVLLSGKLRDFIIFHRRLFRNEFPTECGTRFPKALVALQCNDLYDKRKQHFSKEPRPLDKVALHNLYEVELDGFRAFYYFLRHVCNASDITNVRKRSRKGKKKCNFLLYFWSKLFHMHHKTNETYVKFLGIITYIFVAIWTCVWDKFILKKYDKRENEKEGKKKNWR